MLLTFPRRLGISVPAAQAVLAEGIGTAILVTVIVLASSAGVPTNQGVGFALGACIYALDHISGANFNPAVTFGAVLAGALSWRRGVAYVAAQLIAATLAALAADSFRAVPIPSFNPDRSGAAFGVELFYSMALVLVMQNAAMTKHAREPNSYYGMAICFVVLAGAKSVGPISGGVFNPAVGTAVDIVTLRYDREAANDLWIFWLAPLTGAALATGVARLMNKVEHEHVSLPVPARWWMYRRGHAGEVERVPVVIPIVEFIGTFFLTLTASLANDPFAVGAMLLSMVYMGEHVCGADYNPAVSFGVFLRSGAKLKDLPKLIITVVAQYLGAWAAALLAWGATGTVAYPTPEGYRGAGGAVAWEAAWTSVLVYVVCAVMTDTGSNPELAAPQPLLRRADTVATDVDATVEPQAARRGHARSYQGLAIGFTVAAGIYCSTADGAGSGGVFNPAVGTAIVTVNAGLGGKSASHEWIYTIGPLIGSFIGSGTFLLLHSGRYGSSSPSWLDANDNSEEQAFVRVAAEPSPKARASSMHASLLTNAI